MIKNKGTLLLILGVFAFAPTFAQKFTKKESARREARAQNYFYGASFTLTSGYVHSWMSKSDVALSSLRFGETASFMNTHDAFDLGFIYDHALTKQWGLQTGLYYVQKGGEEQFYYDAGTGYGRQLRSITDLKINDIEWQGMGRYFIPLTNTSRLSVNAGIYASYQMSCHSEGVRKWDYGFMCGVGFDWTHLAVSVNYQPGINKALCKYSDTRMNALLFNVGYRFWKK